MMKATIYSSAICPYCVAAKNYLRNKGVDYEEVRIDLDPVRREEMLARARRTSVPQIFFEDVHVGGYDDLVAADRSGRLARILAGDPT
jgi:glutaredoxin 3